MLGSILSEASLIRLLTPLIRALFSGPCHLSEALSPDTITWRNIKLPGGHKHSDQSRGPSNLNKVLSDPRAHISFFTALSRLFWTSSQETHLTCFPDSDCMTAILSQIMECTWNKESPTLGSVVLSVRWWLCFHICEVRGLNVITDIKALLCHVGTSLVVQQVRFQAPKAGVPDFIFGWGVETVYLRLELEPTWLGLEPNQNPLYLVSGPNKLEFLMSHHRQNSVRDKK